MRATQPRTARRPGASSRRRAPVSALFEPADDVEPELGRARAVDDPVVEGQREVADLRRDDGAVAHDRARADAADAQDRDLGMVDDRRLEEAPELAGA